MLDNRLSHLFMNQVKVLQKQLEGLLDKEIKTSPENETPFEAKTLREEIHFLNPPSELSSEKEKMLFVFQQIVSFFNSGLLFEKLNSDSSPKCIAAFEKGHFFPLKGVEIDLQFKLPQVSLVEVKRAQSQKIFECLEKMNVIQNSDEDIFILQPHPSYSVLVCSRLGSPWLKLHMEYFQKAVLKACGDF